MIIEDQRETQFKVVFPDLAIVQRFAGIHDRNLQIIEETLDVTVCCRSNEIFFDGNEDSIKEALIYVKAIGELLKERELITEHDIRYLLDQQDSHQAISDHSKNQTGFMTNYRGATIRPRTAGQGYYIEEMEKSLVTVAIGPAGTGKTFLAVSYAVSMLKNQMVDRIIITRPVVEAGEKLGFLPGDLKEKVDPYFRPLYDALFEMLGPDKTKRYIERNIIEIAPLAYMRGRTLNNAFILLDEAQNTTRGQMKMFLTRIGENARAVITGDRTQIDLPDKSRSGLSDIDQILTGVEGISLVKLQTRDVVRHPLVKRIIAAYEKYEVEREEQS